MRFSLTLVVCIALLCARSASALTQFEFEQPYFSEPGQNILDHCVVQDNGLYHLFYLRGNPAVNIGHATTTDFTHWKLEPPVMSPGGWDGLLWAPYLIKPLSNTWFMYYTGVNTFGAQQTGLAFSTDLYNWNKNPDNPIYHPDTTWANWDAGTFCHGRDPHVIEIDGTYYLFVTAQHEWFKGAVACATSTDLIHWTDAGFIYMHNSWHMLESVFILQRNGLFHMFFTEEGVYGTQHMSSPTLFGGWDYSKVDYIDTGHAPQITDTPGGPLFSRHSAYNDQHGVVRYVIKFSPMYWNGDAPSVPRQFALQNDWTFVSGDAFYYQPTFQNNGYVRNEIYATSFVGDGWINSKELYTGPMGYGTPGQYLGDDHVGLIRSKPFSIEGNSISLLVGGGNFPNECYVALVDHNTGDVLYKETGSNSNVMTRRYWDVSPLIGRSVHIEIADQSVDTFGHICVDDIIESGNLLTALPGLANGNNKRARGSSQLTVGNLPTQARLLANTPNPFNPSTTLHFELPTTAAVRIDVYNASGALIRTLLDGAQPAGRHTLEWNGTDQSGRGVASGVYFARLRVEGAMIDTRKLLLVK